MGDTGLVFLQPQLYPNPRAAAFDRI